MLDVQIGPVCPWLCKQCWVVFEDEGKEAWRKITSYFHKWLPSGDWHDWGAGGGWCSVLLLFDWSIAMDFQAWKISHQHWSINDVLPHGSTTSWSYRSSLPHVYLLEEEAQLTDGLKSNWGWLWLGEFSKRRLELINLWQQRPQGSLTSKQATPTWQMHDYVSVCGQRLCWWPGHPSLKNSFHYLLELGPYLLFI